MSGALAGRVLGRAARHLAALALPRAPLRLRPQHRSLVGGAAATSADEALLVQAVLAAARPGPHAALLLETSRVEAACRAVSRAGGEEALAAGVAGRALQQLEAQARADGRASLWLHFDDDYDGAHSEGGDGGAHAHADATAATAAGGGGSMWLVPVARALGFRFHHAEGSRCAMCKWLRDGPSMVPAFGTHQVGVAGLVLNGRGEVLTIKERTRNARWKLPGGLADLGEDFGTTAVREVWEETGVRTAFQSLVGLRHQHGMAWGRSDIYVVCRLRPLSLDIDKCSVEIAEAAWMPVADYLAECGNEMNHSVVSTVARHVLGAAGAAGGAGGAGGEQPGALAACDLAERELRSSVFKDRTFKLYLPAAATAASGATASAGEAAE